MSILAKFFVCLFSEVLHNIFRNLFDNDVISGDTFEIWEKSTDPAELEGKGVAAKPTLQFSISLSELNSDDDEDEDAAD